MEIKLYQNTSPKNYLTKNLIQEKSVSGELSANCSLSDPVINLALDNNILVYNYCYIQAFQRYYYIEKVVINNKMMELTLHVDVLMSYKNDILLSQGIVTRSNIGDSYIADDKVLQTKKIQRQCQKIGNSFTKNENYILQLGG